MAELRNQNRDEKADREQPQRSERETSQPISKREPSRGLSNVYDPFRMMTDLHREMERLFGNFGFGSLVDRGLDRGWAPQIEMYERDNKLIVSADLGDLPSMHHDDAIGIPGADSLHRSAVPLPAKSMESRILQVRRRGC